MADGSSRRAEQQVLQGSKRWKDAQTTSPERTRVWTEPPAARIKRMSVVYYLSRNGQLEHPHFMEVPLSCPDGLYLKDVISRLNLLRGKGMATMYSWSSKRSYKNGFVWHDLSESDYIHPVHGQEYVLKGSEILIFPDEQDPSSSSHIHSGEGASLGLNKSAEAHKLVEDSDASLTMARRSRNQSWSTSYNLHEYKVYKTESHHRESSDAKSVAADAATQTDDRRRRHRTTAEIQHENQIVELSREESSPPPVDSSPETLESLMKADKRLILDSRNVTEDAENRAAGECQSGRLKPSSVLMQLITCGSFSFRDHCGATAVKDHGLSLISQYNNKFRMPGTAAGDEDDESLVNKEVEALMEYPRFERVTLEDKEYFSGSVILETKTNEFSSLKRSSSYNADRVSSKSQLEEVEEQEMGSVKAKCIPRRSKASSFINSSSRKATKTDSDGAASDVSNKQHGSKRHEATAPMS